MLLKTLCCLLTFHFLITVSVLAQTSVINAKQYLDVHTGEMIRPALIVIEDGRIASINPESLPENAETIDWSGYTVLPGLIDAHVHLTGELSRDSQLRNVTESTVDRTIQGVMNARKTLMAGFTTVRDVSADGFINVALAKASAQGWIEAPYIVPAGYALSITGGHGDAGGYAPGILEGDYRQGVADGPDEVRKAVRYQIKQGAKVIKMFATAGVLSFEEAVGAQQFTYEEIRAGVEEAGRHGIKVAAHAHGAEGIVAAVKAGVASIEHGSILTDEAIELMIANGTFLVPTTYLTEAVDLDMLPPLLREKGEHVIPRAQESLERAIKAGVKIAFGTDAAVIPHGTNAKEFAALVKRGMAPIEAIKSATIHAADLLGLQDRGTIEIGQMADLIALDNDPTQDIAHIESPQAVIKAGTLINK